MPLERPNIIFVFEDAAGGNCYGIQSWARRINLSEAQKCWVMAIDHRKAIGSKEHEFLFITLWYPPHFNTHMIAERCVILGSASSSVLAMPSSSPLTPASDTIRFSDGPYSDSYSLGCWTFTDRYPSVVDLCAVMYAVSKEAPYYVAYDKQCFWFAGTVYGVLTKEYYGTEVAGRSKKQATYMSLPMPTDTVDDVESIRRKYRSMWEEFVASTVAERVAPLQQARAEARQEGRDEGREEGREEGRAAGRAESEAEIAELRRQLGID